MQQTDPDQVLRGWRRNGAVTPFLVLLALGLGCPTSSPMPWDDDDSSGDDDDASGDDDDTAGDDDSSGDDDSAGDDDDSATGDDDDSTGDDDDPPHPCNPTEAQFLCEGPAVPWEGADSYDLVIENVPLYRCTEDIWTTGPIRRDLPPDTMGFYFGLATSGIDAGWIARATGPEGNDLIRVSEALNLFGGEHGAVWSPEAGGIVFPQSPETAPQEGCHVIWPIVQGPSVPRTDVMMGLRRTSSDLNALDFNVGIVSGLDVTEESIEAALEEVARIYTDSGGPGLGEISYFEIDDDSLAVIEPYTEPMSILRSTVLGTNDRAVNLYVIEDIDGGAIGIAGGIPGGLGVQGWTNTGVMVELATHRRDSGLNTNRLAEVIAHEVGHWLGLYHTTEMDGELTDPLDDTPRCTWDDDENEDGYLAPGECPDGNNVMFPTAGRNHDQLSAQQAQVLFNSPVVR